MNSLTCSHALNNSGRHLCVHLLHDRELDSTIRFTGRSCEYDLVCLACSKATTPELASVCENCFQERQSGAFDVSGTVGSPEVKSRSSDFKFKHTDIRMPTPADSPFCAVAPSEDSRHADWLAISRRGELFGLHLGEIRSRALAVLTEKELDFTLPVELHPSPCGDYVGIVNTHGRHGVIVDLRTGLVTLRLDRGSAHIDHGRFSIAFFRDGDRTLLIHATAWNRLDISEPGWGNRLTERTTAEPGKPAHELDYFHCSLLVSPNGKWLIDDGWFWHPLGLLVRLDLQRWLHENAWESEDGPSLRTLRQVQYLWDVPKCFIDEKTLVVWGFGNDDEWMVNGALVFDVESAERIRWFAGPPKGRFFYDGGHLFVVTEDQGTSVWDIQTGERLHEDIHFSPTAYHPTLHHFLTIGEKGLRISRGTTA